MILTGNETHDISLHDAAILTKNYRNNDPDPTCLGEYFSGAAIRKILNQQPSGCCVGIRIYYGRSNEGDKKLVLVGVDKNGNDLCEGPLMEYGMSAPPYNSSSNPLNS
jgi:hypothetical protein